MPQSKQMKLQWLTIDGRNVPFALPQHWNGDDWTITGVDNPLPTANYIEKNGIMVPVSENNPVPTQLTGSIVEELVFDGVEIASGSTSATVDLVEATSVVGDFKEFIIILRSNYSHSYKIEILWNVGHHSSYARFRTIDEFDLTTANFISDPIEMKTVRPSLRLTNLSVSEITYDVHILWRR